MGYDGLGDPRKGKVQGTELMSARDKIQDDVLRDARWCSYCYYAGIGCMGFSPANCLYVGELCCCAGTCKSATCCDDDGCMGATAKCCCCLTHVECPPSNTP